MGAICTYLQLGKSVTMPAYDYAKAIAEFGIQPTDRVLDVGGGDNPFQRADVIAEAHLEDTQHRDGRIIRQDQRYVACFAEDMPFADKEFDFVYCNHVLEHTLDPAAACRELMRVAKRGYIEVPAYWSEYLTGGHHTHRWLIHWEQNRLVFRPKPWVQAEHAPQDSPFAGVLQGYWFTDAEFQHRWQQDYRNLWTLQLLWDDSFEFRVEPGPRHSSLSGGSATTLALETPLGLRDVPLANAFGPNRPPQEIEPLAGRTAEVEHDPSPGLPFADRELDFVTCRQILQESVDPARACEELMRVAKKGYLEIPHLWTELLLGSPSTRWLVELVGGVLTFRRRPFLQSPFKGLLRSKWRDDAEFRYRYDFAYRNLSRVQMEWEDRFAYQVIDEGTGFDYEDPEQAGMSHLVFALNDKQQGATPAELKGQFEKVLEFLPGTARAWFELGLCQEAEGLIDEAQASFARARQLAPDERAYERSQALKPGLTAIIHTLNEEAKLEAALQSLAGWADEIVVVDMHSTDRTREIAGRYTDRVYLHERIRDFDAARNYSASLAKYQWVLYLDADERVAPRLAAGIRSLIEALPETVAGVQFPYKNHFLGKWIHHAGLWWPGYKAPMLLRTGRFHWPGQMHAAPICQGEVVRYPLCDPDESIHHETCESIAHYFRKLETYTEAEAAYLVSAQTPFDWRQAIRGFVNDFWVYYGQTEGHRDGAHGLILSFLSAVYRFTVYAKLFEQRSRQGLATSSESDVPDSLRAIFDYAQEVLRELQLDHSLSQEAAPIDWRAPLFGTGDLAHEARELLFALERMGLPVRASTTEEGFLLDEAEGIRLAALLEPKSGESRLQVTYQQPPESPSAQAARTIGRLTFPTDRLPDEWVERCNRLDEIWVPSDFHLVTFAWSGVRRDKLFKLPMSLEAARYRQDVEPLEIEGRRGFNFLTTVDWSLRAGWDVLLEAYLAEFSTSEDVSLWIQLTSMGKDSLKAIHARILDHIQHGLGRDPEQIPDIVFLDSMLADESRQRLFRAADAFVLPSRGEEWGRSLLEAMAMGLPTIGTGWGGATEFMSLTNSYLIDYRLTEIPPAAVRECPHYAGHRWAEPSVPHLRSLMREVFTDRQAASAKASLGRSEVLTRFDRRDVARRAAERLLDPASSPAALREEAPHA